LYTFVAMLRFILLLLSYFFITTVFAQKKFEIKNDLRSEWKIYQDGHYAAATALPANTKTVYLSIDADKYAKDLLQIQSEEVIYVFINGKLINESSGIVTFRIDSLAGTMFTNRLSLAIHCNRATERGLKTYVVSATGGSAATSEISKPASSFRDFVITAGLILMVLFVVIIRMHPKLAADYFSVNKIFSLREGDEGLSSTRITGSSNILFYVFCSLMIGFFLMIVIRHLPDRFLLPLKFEATTFIGIFWQWVKISSLILILLFAKIFITFSLSILFGMKGIAGSHFQNWIRLMLMVGGMLSVAVFVYYISRGQSVSLYVMFLTSLIVTLAGWIIIAILKLNPRIEHSMFHLFSYICATEIIPLLITIKVLFQ
jgi:hypothetical protein